MRSIREQIQAEGRVLISDGAWGTLLQERGLQPGECPELWCLARRSEVFEIASAYVAAGADMIESNSFGANRFKLEHFGLAERVAELNRAAAAISRAAAGPERHVLASIGPTGKLLLMGDVTEEQLYDAFREQARALEEGGADACCIETFAALDEAAVAVRAVRENTRLETAVTFTFERTRQGEYRTMMGVAPGEMARAMLAAGAHIVGTNCGNGMSRMAEIVREIRAAAPQVPILVHANAGMPVNVDGRLTFPERPDEMARHAVEAARAGANIVGGCCGTTPEHIRALARSLRQSGETTQQRETTA